MSEPSLSLKGIEDILASGPRNVVDLGEELLMVFQMQAMRLDWEDGRCHFQCLPAEKSESSSVPLPKSVFRAILARFAALSNQHAPASVSPYGGAGEFVWDSQRFRIEFSNSIQEGYHLEISVVAQSDDAPAA